MAQQVGSLPGVIQRDPKLMQTGIAHDVWQSMTGRQPGAGEQLSIGGTLYEVTGLGGASRGLKSLGGGAGGAMTGGGDVIAQAQRLYEQEQKWKKPAISTLEAGRGRIPGIFDPQRADIEAEKDPLKQRYESLLKDITGKTEIAFEQEYAKRGISPLSSSYQQALAKQLEIPTKQIGLERETGLRELTRMQTGLGVEEAGMGLDIDRTIAQIQASTGQSAVQAATTLYNIQQQQRQSDADRAIQQQLADLRGRETGLAEQQFEYGKQQPDYSQYTALGEGQSIFDLAGLRNIFKNPKTYKPGTDGGNNPGGI